MKQTFPWRGFDLDLFAHPYNDTLTNERAVEIPIAMDFMARAEGAGLEVGNVLGHYFTDEQLPPRRIVDRFEVARGVENLDLFEVAGTFDWIVSVSTIEHVRWHPGTNQHNPFGAVAGLAYLCGLLAPGGSMLVTVGLGQNAVLDAHVLKADSAWTTFVRRRGMEPNENEWFVDWPTAKQCEYGPTHGANTVWVGEW